MYQQIPPLVVELLLFAGFKEEAETLFSISPVLSKDFDLCYNMLTLTPDGLICRASSKGDYKTVKDLCEFYTRQFESQDEDNTYEYMSERLYSTYTISYEFGPMLSALKNGHVEIYKLLTKYNGRHVYHSYTESSIAELLITGMGEGLLEELSPIIEDVNPKDFSDNDIKRISSYLKECYSDWAELCKEQDNYSETGFVCVAALYQWEAERRCTTYDKFRIIGKVIPFSQFLYTLAIKLNIKPSQYMTEIEDLVVSMCECGCDGLPAKQKMRDAWCKEIKKSHLEGYGRMLLTLTK